MTCERGEILIVGEFCDLSDEEDFLFTICATHNNNNNNNNKR
jgi:hypothetical protein